MLKDCAVEWSHPVPEPFTHAIEAQDAPGLKIVRFSGTAAHPGRDEAVINR